MLRERSANVVSNDARCQEHDVKLVEQQEVFQDAEEGPTPAIVRCALGPTPQKDGEILGLFDMLSGETPSKGGDAPMVAPITALSATPSKAKTLPSSLSNFSKTPQSSAKRKFLEAFAGTPLKRKRDDEAGCTPSTAKRQYATPAFLRRSFALAPIDEEGNEAAVAAPPVKKRGLVRSLSTIIQNLKKQEDERMDDEWDIMNEIEAEGRGEPNTARVPKVLVEDSQAVEMPLGPDQGIEPDYDASEPDAGALDANGKPRSVDSISAYFAVLARANLSFYAYRKVWKKKGLKRQTRRVIMRPVQQRSKKASAMNETGHDEESTEAVAETQLPELLLQRHSDKEEDANLLPADESDYQHDSHQSSQATAAPKSRRARTAKAPASHEERTEDSNARKKVKKVSAQAHANFRKLNIKHKNSKAKGKGGRFGRR